MARQLSIHLINLIVPSQLRASFLVSILSGSSSLQDLFCQYSNYRKIYEWQLNSLSLHQSTQLLSYKARVITDREQNT